jgi:acetyl/propionyl-CoA carboxylase alpha subunit
VESALYRGFEMTLYYDPMMAKVVVWGETRAEAILRMRRALNEYRIGGIKTSIPFHQEIMDSTEFIWGTFDTGFIERRQMSRPAKRSADHERIVAVAAAMMAHEEGRQAVYIGSSDSDHRSNLWKQAGRIRALRGRW